MKRYINKRKILIGLVLSTITTCSVVGFGLSQNQPTISKVGTSNQALQDNSGGSTTQTGTTYTVSQTQQPSGKYANQITQNELQNVLTPADSTIKFSVVILPITEANLNQGSIDFLIYEQLKQSNGTYKTSFADAEKSTNLGQKNKESTNAKSDNTIDTNILNQYEDSDNQKAQQKNVFSTSKFTNLNNWITKKTYDLKWKKDSEIEEYIKNKQDSTLTADDVWLNLIDNTDLPPLATSSTKANEPATKITVENVTSNGASNNGLYKVNVSLENVAKDTLVGTQNNSITKWLGGFVVDGTRKEFQLVGNPDISALTVNQENLFNVGDGTAAFGSKLSDLTPSEFASPNGGISKLIDIVTNGTGIGNNTNKIFTMSYGSITNIQLNTGSSGSSPQSLTLDSKANDFTLDSVRKDLKITNIDPVPNDSDGSLQLVIYYDTFDVYTGTIANEVTTFNFPAGTFKINPNANKDLFITWKNASSLENMNYSYEVVNEYYKNKDDPEFARIFSNKFLETTDAVKAMPRTVEINYGQVNGSESNGSLVSSDDKTVKVKLTFNSWGSTGKQFVIENVFTLQGYRYDNNGSSTDALTFSWKDNKTLFDENRQYSELTPSDVVLNLMKNSSSIYQTFVLGADSSNANSVQISIKPDDINGTITVYLRRADNSGTTVVSPSTHIYQQLYVGFKKSTNGNDITSFSFPPQSEVSNELLAIPLTSVTKEDVINLYLKDTDLFKDKTLTEDNVEITPVINDNGESHLVVKVVISTFNQDSAPSVDKQTFYTVITGFSTNSYVNNTLFNPPKDLTAIISISSAVSISIILGTVLIALLTKRAGVKVYKKNDEILKKTKDRI